MRRVLIIAFDGAQTLDVTGPAEVFAAVSRVLGRQTYEIVFASMGGGHARELVGLADGHARSRARAPAPRRHRDRRRRRGGSQSATRSPMGARRLATARDRPRAAHGLGLLGRVHPGRGRPPRRQARGDALDRAAIGSRGSSRASPSTPTRSSSSTATSGRRPGVTTGIDMALAMVEQDHGRALADRVAARLVLYVRRPGFQSQFSDAQVAQTGGSDPLGPGDRLGAPPPGRRRRRDARPARGAVGAHAAPALPRDARAPRRAS